MLEPWKALDSKLVADCRVFQVRARQKASPRTGEPHEFFVIDSVNWVNVVAVTPDDNIVLVEQFRHGTDTVELEVPGGMIDPEDESPVAAAVRELSEETGYEGDEARVIGTVLPNPAIMSNTCYVVAVQNCRLLHPTRFDHSEDLVTRVVPARSIPELVSSGKIRHSLVAVALFHYQLWRERLA